MKFRFIGDPRNGGSGPDILEKFDHVFTRSDWTEVTDEFVIRKLLGSDHFEGDGSIETDPAIKAVGDERETLIAEAESLGISVDRRWSNLTLRMKIRESRLSKPYSFEGMDENAE